MVRPTALERARLQLPGPSGELVLAESLVTITKRVPTRSQVRVGIDQVRGTAMVAPRLGGRGWLHVNVIGGTPAPSGELVAMTDPYAVRITARTAGAAKRFARLVHDHLRARGLPPEPDLVTPHPPDGRYSSAVVLTDHAVSRPPDPEAGMASDHAATVPQGHLDEPAGGTARQLAQLAELHAGGALTDEELARLRARVLG